MPTVYLVEDPSIRASCPPLKILQQEVTKAYFAKRGEEAQYRTTVKEHTTKKGETLSKIAKKHGVKTKHVKRTKTTKYLQVGEIVKVTTKEKTGIKVKFTKSDKATVGEEAYIVVETLHLEEEIVNINILQGQEDVLAKKDQRVTVQQDGQDVTMIKTKVGNYCEEDDIVNKDEFVDWAIAKVKLRPKAKTEQKKWKDALECAGEKKALLYLLVDVHSENSIPNFKSQYVLYKGFKDGKDNSPVPNHFLNEDEAWFEVKDKKVKINYLFESKKEDVSKKSKDLLKKVGRKSNNYTVNITSTIRSARKQAEVMYRQTVSKGVKAQKKLYGGNGDKIIDVYVAQLAKKKTKEQIITKMEEKINEIGASKVSNHCGDSSTMNVIDISSRRLDNPKDFLSELEKAKTNNEIDKVINETDRNCYHIEITQ